MNVPVGLAVPKPGEPGEQQIHAVADLGLGDPDHPTGPVLVGVLLYLELRARKERLSIETLRADLQASAA
jgi:hypothetical protein